jgi:hypothetical protein
MTDGDTEDATTEENIDTQSTTHVRRGHGPNRIPSGRYVIAEVIGAREPKTPTALVNVWTNIIGKSHRRKGGHHLYTLEKQKS